MMHKAFLQAFLLFVISFCVQSALAQSSNTSKIEEKLRMLAVEKVKTKCQSCKVKVEYKWISPKIAESSPQNITGLYFSEIGIPAGYVDAKVVLKGAASTAENAVQLFVSIQQKVPVAERLIKRGAAINKKDLVWKWKDISRLNRQPITSVKAFKNKTAARMILKGHLFFASDLVTVHSIQPGDHVVMMYNEEGVRIEINCIARQTRGEDDKIRLFSKETSRHYLAKITGKNKIIWVKTL